MAGITLIETTESETPLRTVLSNYRGITGYVTTACCGRVMYEFPVERDFLEKLDFNPRVKLIRAQPVRVHFLDETGAQRRYTADFYVEYHSLPGQRPWRPRLFEVKTVLDLRSKISDLRPKLMAAQVVCKQRDWLFRIATDRVIRNVRNINVSFLRKFRARPDPHGYAQMLLEGLAGRGQISVMRLLEAISADSEVQLTVLPVLWRLVATQRIRTDLERPVTMASPIWAATHVNAP